MCVHIGVNSFYLISLCIVNLPYVYMGISSVVAKTIVVGVTVKPFDKDKCMKEEGLGEKIKRIGHLWLILSW